MRTVFFFFLLVLFSSCGTSKKANTDVNTDKVKRATLGNVNLQTDSYTIKSARIEKNKMILQVDFSGGCIGFSADLIGAKFIMKSLPAKRGVQFVLKKEGNCRELKSEQFVFDISELAYKKEKGSEIILLLDGYDSTLTYVYD